MPSRENKNYFREKKKNLWNHLSQAVQSDARLSVWGNGREIEQGSERLSCELKIIRK